MTKRFTPWVLGSAIAALAAGGGLAPWAQTEARGQDQDKPAIARPQAAGGKAEAAPKAPAAEAPPPASEPPAGATPAPATSAPATSSANQAPGEAPADPEGIPPEMAALFPVGRVFEGVRIPSYHGDALSSVIHSRYMKRADDEHLEMELLEIVTYQAGEADTRIETDRAIFDTVAKTLRSTTSAKILQQQFEMRGDRMIFDSNSRVGHLSGNVKTLVFNTGQFRKGTPSAPTGGAAAPSSPELPTPERKETVP